MRFRRRATCNVRKSRKGQSVTDMKTLYVNQELRPLRLCFVVGRDNESLLKSIAINTTLWGGIYNPIINFKKTEKSNIRRNLGLIKEFDPDFIVDLSKGLLPEISDKIEQSILKPGEFFFSDVKDKRKGYRIGLRAYAAFIDEIPDGGLPEKIKKRLSLIKAPQQNLTLFYAIKFGLLDKKISPDIVDFVEKKLGLKTVRLDFSQYAQLEESKYVGPIAVTTSQLRVMGGGGGFSSSLIFIGNHRKRDDLLEYWNLRASGRVVFFLPIENYSSFKAPLKEFIDGSYVDERLNRVDLDLQIAPSLLRDSGKFEEIADWIKGNIGSNPPRRIWLANWGRRSKRVSPDINCITPLYSREKIPVSYTKDEVSSFTASSPKFIDDLFHKDNAWVVNLSFIGFYENNYTIDLPNQEGMNELAKRELTFGSWEQVRVSDKGLVFCPDSRDDIITIRPVPVEKVVDVIFDKVGFKRRPSSPGIFAHKILQMMDGIEGCRVFKIKGVREALAKMNKDQGEVIVNGKKIKGEIAKPRPMLGNAIRDVIKSTRKDRFGSKNWAGDFYENLILYSGQPTPLTSEIVFDYLINKKLITPGRKFKCSNCSCEDWYKIGTFSETFQCVYCRYVQDIPRIDDPNWFYKTEGLVAISDEGRGSLPVILSLWRLVHHSSMDGHHFVTSFEIADKSSDNFDKELDYFFFKVDNFSKTIEVVIGEARNYVEYKPKEVTKTIKIAQSFKNKPYIAFTTLKDKFSDKEINLLKNVMKQGYYILPFTRLDLDPYDLYDRFNPLKNKYAVTLEDFSVNLCALNLNMQEGNVYDLVGAEEKKRIEKMIAWLDKKREQLAQKEAVKQKK